MASPAIETADPPGAVPTRGGRCLRVARLLLAFCMAFLTVTMLGSDASATISPSEPGLGGTSSAAFTWTAPLTGTAKVAVYCMDGSGNMRTPVASTVSAVIGNVYSVASTSCGAVGYVVTGYVLSYGSNFWWTVSNGASYTTAVHNGGTLISEWPIGFTSDLLTVPSTTCSDFVDSVAEDAESVYRKKRQQLVTKWDWQGGTYASAGFRLKRLDTGKILNAGNTVTYTGNGVYTVTDTSATRPTAVRVWVVGHPDCYIDYGVEDYGFAESDDDGSGGPGDYGAADDGEGNDCSSFDIFCRIKGALAWAFVPDDETIEQYTDLGDDIATKIPFVYVAGTFELLSFNLPDCTSDTEGCIGYSYNGLFTFPTFDIGGEAMGGFVVLDSGDVVVETMRDWRAGIAAFIWILMLAPLGFWIWRRLFPVVGSGGQ